MVLGLSTSSLQHPHLLLHHLHQRILFLTSDETPKIQYPKEVEIRKGAAGNPMHKPTETENKNKNEGREEVQRDISHELPAWLEEFRRIWSMKVLQQSLGETQRKEVKTLPVLLMIYQRSREQK